MSGLVISYLSTFLLENQSFKVGSKLGQLKLVSLSVDFTSFLSVVSLISLYVYQDPIPLAIVLYLSWLYLKLNLLSSCWFLKFLFPCCFVLFLDIATH